MKCKRSSDARAHDHHTLQIMRQQAVKAVRHGETADSVSKAIGVNIPLCVNINLSQLNLS